MEVAAENDKAQGKEGENEGVFFWFGDDLAVDDNPHRTCGVRRKIRPVAHPIIESSRKEVANRFVNYAGAYPRRSLPVGKGQIASVNANS